MVKTLARNNNPSALEPKKLSVETNIKMKPIKQKPTLDDSNRISFFFSKTATIRAKVFRAILIILAWLGTMYVCFLSSKRYMNSFVQTVVERTDVHVSEIPFPAVTLCPTRYINDDKIYEAKKKFLRKNSTNEDNIEFDKLVRTIEYMSTEQAEPVSYSKLNSLTNRIVGLDYIKISDLINLLTIKCEDFFIECQWRRVKFPCCDLFKIQKGSFGICFSFNSINAMDANPTWPWRTHDAGKNSALRILYNISYTQKRTQVGLMITDPYDTPLTHVIYLDGEKISINIDPLKFVSDNEIRILKPNQRHCYFEEEIDQRNYLSKNYCMASCRYRTLFLYCNCAPEILSEHFNAPVCNASHYGCLLEHKHDILLASSNFPTAAEENTTLFDPSHSDCHCYPKCNFVQYKIAAHINSESQNADWVSLNIFFGEETMFSYKTSLVFNLLDLIVSYGGIAGLILGCSMLGIVESLCHVINLKNIKKSFSRKFKISFNEDSIVFKVFKCNKNKKIKDDNLDQKIDLTAKF